MSNVVLKTSHLILLFLLLACSPNENKSVAIKFIAAPFDIENEPLHLQSELGLQYGFCKAAYQKSYTDAFECYEDFKVSVLNKNNWTSTKSISEMDSKISYVLNTKSTAYSIRDNDFRYDDFFISCDSDHWYVFFSNPEGGIRTEVRVRADSKDPIIFEQIYSKEEPTDFFNYISESNTLRLEHLIGNNVRIARFNISNFRNEVSDIRQKCKSL